MFPSMNNLYYPSFYNNHSPSFTTSLETNNIFLQNHLEFVSNYNNNYLRTSNNNNIHPILENPTNLFSLQAPIIDSPSSNNVINKKVSSKNREIVKRNRHTKIWTAQGVRDRRVRLSINIAREFFNLQDMLGFDKASKTVGWLLEKSKDAIHELTTTTSTAKPSLISTFDRENVILNRNYEMNDVFGVDKLEDSSKNTVSKKRRRVRPQDQLQPKTDGQSVALKTIRRARRARARDRARERTKNKNTTTLHNHHNNHTHLESLNQQHHQIIDQQSRVDDEQLNDQLIFHQSISGCSPPSSISTTLMPCGGINKGVSVRESVVIKSKSRDESSLNYNYNFNDMITIKDYDVGCYDYYHNDYNNFCGIIHTPGLSSALNIINLSKEIHINGKPWDDYRNQDLH